MTLLSSAAWARTLTLHSTAADIARVVVPATQTAITTTGFAMAGDLGAARYKRVAGQPAHFGRIQSADGAWWELAEPAVTPEMFGAKGDGVTDDFDAVARWADFINRKSPGVTGVARRTYWTNRWTAIAGPLGNIYAGVHWYADDIDLDLRGAKFVYEYPSVWFIGMARAANGGTYKLSLTGADPVSGTIYPAVSTDDIAYNAAPAQVQAAVLAAITVWGAITANAVSVTGTPTSSTADGNYTLTFQNGLLKVCVTITIVSAVTGATAKVSNRTYRPWFLSGSGKKDPANWGYRCVDTGNLAALCDLAGTTVPKGATSVTLATPTDADKFARGDIAFLRTGQLLDNGYAFEPNSELLVVASANRTTGVVAFTSPICGVYAREWFLSGQAGLTATSPNTGTPSSFSLAKVTDRVMHRFRSIGGRIICGPSVLQAVSIWGAMNVEIRQLRLDYPNLGLGGRDARNVTLDVQTEHDGTVNAGTYNLAPSTGCSDWDITLNHRSKGFNFLHFHEKTKRMRVHRPRLINAGSPDSANGAIDFAAGVVDAFVDTPLIDTGSSDSPAIYVEGTCNGGIVVLNPIITNNAVTTSAVVNYGSNVDIAGERLLGANSKVSHLAGIAQKGGITSRPRTVQFAVTATQKSCTIPACYFQYDQSLRVTFDVVEAFNAGAANTVSLGYSGNAALVSGLPVAATGAGEVAPGSPYAGAELGRSIQSQFTLAKDLVLTFNGTGAAPSAGKVVVTLLLTKSQRLS